MKKFAVLDSSNNVVNIIIAKSKEIAEDITSSICVQINVDDSVDMGYIYNGTTFAAPEAEPEA